MKKIAIFGFGNHVKKNIIPAVLRSDRLEISFIVRRKLNDDVSDEYQDIKFITLDESFKIINHKNTNLIYISNPTSKHFKWSKQAILNNFNVLCEKPLTDSYKKTKKLIELAKINSVKIQEVCIYKYHKQFLYLKNLISSISNDIEDVLKSFSRKEVVTFVCLIFSNLAIEKFLPNNPPLWMIFLFVIPY